MTRGGGNLPEKSQTEIDTMTPREFARAEVGGGHKRRRTRGLAPGQRKPPEEVAALEANAEALRKAKASGA